MSTLPTLSPPLLAGFRRYARGYLARHLHTVRLSRQPPAPQPPPAQALVVYLNHPSWWDPLVGLLLASTLYPGRAHYAPIDAAALARYRFFARLGFFGVAPGTAAGARRFLAVSEQVLARPATALWVTGGGRFADPRERPVALRSGLGHLARRLARRPVGVPVLFLPLALEYPFWEERTPEALARFGVPLAVGGEPHDAALAADDWTARLAGCLQETQDALAAEAVARDPAAFEVLLGGAAGVGGVYDLWRRLRARLRGERFQREHGAALGHEQREPGR
jgi:1-acyl-sn-glycerol-3-phosphate acyltransferase